MLGMASGLLWGLIRLFVCRSAISLFLPFLCSNHVLYLPRQRDMDTTMVSLQPPLVPAGLPTLRGPERLRKTEAEPSPCLSSLSFSFLEMTGQTTFLTEAAFVLGPGRHSASLSHKRLMKVEVSSPSGLTLG